MSLSYDSIQFDLFRISRNIIIRGDVDDDDKNEERKEDVSKPLTTLLLFAS